MVYVAAEEETGFIPPFLVADGIAHNWKLLHHLYYQSLSCLFVANKQSLDPVHKNFFRVVLRIKKLASFLRQEEQNIHSTTISLATVNLWKALMAAAVNG